MGETIRIGDIVLDTSARRATRTGEALELSDLSFDLLAALAEAAPEPLSNQDLAERVWKRSHVTDHTIAQRVAMVRRALGDSSDEPRFIRTVRGRGYAFIVPPEDLGGSHRFAPGKKVFAGVAAALALMATAAFVSRTIDRDGTAGEPRDIAAVIVDPETGAVRISGPGRRFLPPVLATVEGKALFVGSVPDLEQLEGSREALAMLCALAKDPSQATTPIPRSLRDFMASPEVERACSRG
jgi:DNA-binding winged helix-turn-helix (wHTH) protein